MKKIIYIFVPIALLFLFTNNASGPVLVQQVGYTGSPVDQSNTCSACHSGGNYGASDNLEVLDAAGTTVVTKYQPNTQYTIRLTISVASGNPVGYGFHMIDLRAADNSNVKGFLPTAQQSSGIGIRTIASSGRIYAEHTSRLTTKVINVKWKAPATNVGTIVFYAAAMAVNGSSNESGDSPTAGTSIQLPAATTGVNELAENIKIELSPNPTPSNVLLSLDSKWAKPMKIQMTDIRGRIVLFDNWAINVGNNQRILDMHTFTKGMYMLQILDSENIVSKKLIKL